MVSSASAPIPAGAEDITERSVRYRTASVRFRDDAVTFDSAMEHGRAPNGCLSYGYTKGALVGSLHNPKEQIGPTKEAKQMDKKTSEVLQGTLDLMILKTLHALGPQHGFGIARRIEQVSRDVLQLNEGTVYTSLLRLQQQGWIAAAWGTSENNRKAKFYSITARGRKQLEVETENWERISGVIRRVLRQEAEG